MVDEVIGNYQLVRKLGEGGMGVVYLGQHTLLGRRAALKILLPSLSAQPDVVNRFFNEARAVTSISDPGIVQVFDFGYHTDGRAFIVMEYLEGEPLDRRLARLGRLPAYETLRLSRQLAGSLAAAHGKGIVHRDLKPENIFLVRDAEVASGERCKILDFGIAKLSNEHPGKLKTSTGVVMGTPMYMSPEQCRGFAEVDHRSDIYSLGCVLFHLLTGRPPFDGEGPGDIISAHIREPAPTPSSQAPDIPPNVDAVVLRCLAKTPADRYQTMTDLARATGLLLSRLPASVAVTTSPAYHLLPTAKVPLGDAPMGRGFNAPATPTTLGASSGQLARAESRARQLVLWVAGGLVVAAAGIAIAIVSTRGSDASHATPRPIEQKTVEGGSPSDASDGPGFAGSAGLAPGEPPEVQVPGQRSVVGDVIDAGGMPRPIEHVEQKPRTANVAVAKQRIEVKPGTRAKPKTDTKAEPAKNAGPETRAEQGTSTTQAVRTSQGAEMKPAVTSKQVTRPNHEPEAKSVAGTKSTRGSQDPVLAAKCAKTAFAAVYNAVAPSKQAVYAALEILDECSKDMPFSAGDYKETKDALMGRLVVGH